jgi:hypothetical protein
MQLHLQCLGGALGLVQLHSGDGIGWVRQHRHVGDRWHGFFERIFPSKPKR